MDGGLNTYAYVGNNPVSLVDPTGLATINLFKENTIANAMFSSIKAPIGQTFVLAHANKNGVYDNRKNDPMLLSSSALSDVIRSNGWNPNEPVTLVACNVADNPSYAQEVADNLNTTVYVADAYVHASGNGTMNLWRFRYVPASLGSSWYMYSPKSQ